MSSGWPIGVGKCGSLIASKCGSWGKGAAVVDLAGTLLGIGTVIGSMGLLSVNLKTGNRAVRRNDTPFGTQSTILATSWPSKIGIQYVTLWSRWRGFPVFTIPAGTTIGVANLLIPGWTTYGSGFNLKVYANSSASNPCVTGDWATVANGGNADSGTLIGTVPASSSDVYLPVPVGLLTANADNKFSICSDQDLADVSPGAANQYMAVPAPKLLIQW